MEDADVRKAVGRAKLNRPPPLGTGGERLPEQR